MKQPSADFVLPDFHVLFESAPGLYLVLSADLKIVAVTNAYLKATKTRRNEIIGKGIFEIFPDNPDDPTASGVSNLHASLKRVLKTKTPDAMAVQKYDIPLPESEGGGFEERYWSPLNTPVLGSDQEVKYIIHRVEDVTEFIRLKQKGTEQQKVAEELKTRAGQMENEIFLRAQQLQQANQKLREVERMKDEFFANISHELRTPLTLIMAPLESMLANDFDLLSPKQVESLKVMHNNAIRLLQMVNAVLDYSKLEAGKMIVHREPTDVRALTESIFSDFKPRMKQKNITGKLVFQPEKIYAFIDRYLYEKILFNFLSNALKFTNAGGSIDVDVNAEKGTIQIKVKDTGIGIPLEKQKNLFEKFTQVEGNSTRRFEGTGLGLAIVKDFAELLNGKVLVESETRKGSVFTVEIEAPAVEEQQAEKVKATSTFVPQYNELSVANDDNISQVDKPKLLIAEDNPELAAYMAGLLQSIGIVKIATNGEEGLALTREWRPDLILSDVMMPQKDGLSLCSDIKSDQITAKIPVVLLTALTDRESLLKGWKAGADEYLYKPFHPEELLTRIRTLLVNTQKRNEWNRKLEQLNNELEDKVKERTAQLSQYTEQLNHKIAELEQFAYVASHDLQEPLQTILSFVELLHSRYQNTFDEKASKYMHFIVEATERMQALITGLLEYSRIGMQDEMKRVDCNNILKAVIADLNATITKSHAQIQSEDLPTLYAYPIELRLLFQNLISNAIKFRKKDIPPQIKIAAKKENNEWKFSVSDNGIGIDPRYNDRIFMIFKRLHNRKDYEGSGIGLAFCKKIVEIHNGKIWVTSSPVQGSTFYFTINEKINDSTEKIKHCMASR